jgi:hypothetical protein
MLIVTLSARTSSPSYCYILASAVAYHPEVANFEAYSKAEQASSRSTTTPQACKLETITHNTNCLPTDSGWPQTKQQRHDNPQQRNPQKTAFRTRQRAHTSSSSVQNRQRSWKQRIWTGHPRLLLPRFPAAKRLENPKDGRAEKGAERARQNPRKWSGN